MQPDPLSYENLGPGVLFAWRYEILEELGQGSFGRVFRARDRTTGSAIVLKALHPSFTHDKHLVQRVMDEVLAVREIAHPRLCHLHRLAREGNVYYLTMEYIPGRSLARLVAEDGPFPLFLALRTAQQICQGLDAAHSRGAIHGELTPYNVMLDREYSAKILDFGLARYLGSGATGSPGLWTGRMNYLSPEQLRGESGDHRSDLYSFGLLLLELLSGKPPEPSPGLPELPAKLPQPVRDLLHRCLALDPADRYTSARAILDDLDSLVYARRGDSAPGVRTDIFGKPLPARGLDSPTLLDVADFMPGRHADSPAPAPDEPALSSNASAPAAQAGPEAAGAGPASTERLAHEPWPAGDEAEAPEDGGEERGPRADTLEPLASVPAMARPARLLVPALLGTLLVVLLVASSLTLWHREAGWDDGELAELAPAGEMPDLDRVLRMPAIVAALADPTATAPPATATPAGPGAAGSATAPGAPLAEAAELMRAWLFRLVTGLGASPSPAGAPAALPTAEPQPTAPAQPAAGARSTAAAAPAPPAAELQPTAAAVASPPARPRPTARAATASVVLNGLPDDSEVCLDGRLQRAQRHGDGLRLPSVRAGRHWVKLTNERIGAGGRFIDVPDEDGATLLVQLEPGDWKQPAYFITLRTSAGRPLRFEKTAGAPEDVRLPSGELVRLSLDVSSRRLTLRRANGSEHQTPCTRPERRPCRSLPPLDCGQVILGN
jgi:hypothetical protein